MCLRNHLPRIQISLVSDIQLFITCLGLGLGFFCIHRARSMESVANTIKVSYAALKGIKAIQTIQSFPHTLVFATKALMKGYKKSKRFEFPQISVRSPGSVTKKLKSFNGLLHLIRYAHSVLPWTSQRIGFLGILSVVYKLSKNSVKTLESFMGIESGDFTKKGLDALGLIVKTVFITRGLSRMQETENCRFVSAICARNSFSGPDCPGLFIRRNNCELAYGKSSDVRRISPVYCIRIRDVESCISDILCLSIPVDSEYLTDTYTVP